jgi:hypothetical protein
VDGGPLSIQTGLRNAASLAVGGAANVMEARRKRSASFFKR